MMSAPKPHKWLNKLAPYVPGRASADGVREPVKLSANESVFGPSPAAIGAYVSAQEKLMRYPEGGANQLRQAIASVHGLRADQIVCSAGSDEILLLLAQAYAGPGDEIIHSRYGFSYYPLIATSVGAVPVAVENENWTASVDGILAAVTPRTKIIFLDNPNNPTGTYLSVAEVARLHAGLRSDILLVLDAAYAEAASVDDYDAGAAMVDAHANVVMTRTFSKLYALAALRVGWGYMPPAIADTLNRMRSPFNVNLPAQAAATAAVLDQDHLAAAVAFNCEGRSWLTAELSALGLRVVPSQTNFILIEFPDEKPFTAEDANNFLAERGILLRWLPGQGLASHLRMTVGTIKQNQSVVMLLKQLLSGEKVT